MRVYQAYIDGVWTDAAGGATIASIEPYTGTAWATIPECGPQEVDAAVTAANRALHGEWRRVSPTARGNLLLRLADIIDANAEEIAQIECRDNGKVYREMIGQARGLSQWYRHFAGYADKIAGRTITADKPDFHIYTRREPIGVVGAITAWNSPLLLLAYKLAPALAAGCTFVVKPSELASASTLLFAKLVEQAGFPAGVFSVITGGRAAGEALVAHPLINKVTFTGSTPVGRRVGVAAAEHFASASLELGGKSANIVFDDASLDKAVNGAIAGIFAAGGQTCMAGSRLLAHERIADELVARIIERANTIRLGDPSESTTEMGPLISGEHVQFVHGEIQGAEREGARVVAGGTPLPDLGPAFLAPTVIDHVDQSMRIANTELFAPVLAVERFSTEEEAVRIANATDYGLVAGVWTENLARAHRMAAALDAGTVWVNAYRTVSFAVPTSGRKDSGSGYENGAESLDEYLMTKSVWVNLSEATRDPFTMG